ncbi:MAG: cryptochrome/photolyase family protein [Paracoccaceae bacterium]|nr:cryptochrome/photolyase family protein [Paracoccaceae bacterium]
MTTDNLLILLGNQLFQVSKIKLTKPKKIFMAEDFDLCTYEKQHKLKILMFLSAMREKRDELKKNGFDIEYYDINHPTFKEPFEHKIKNVLAKNHLKNIVMFEIEDKNFETRIIEFSKKENLNLKFIPSPMFLIDRSQFKLYKTKSKKIQMGAFYKEVRRKLNLLLDQDMKPLGGKWSFDEENRQKIPHELLIPEQYHAQKSKYCEVLKPFIETTFHDHPGNLKNIWPPMTRNEALKSLDSFLKNKFKKFGIYEDAILTSHNFLFHSGMSPSLNMGLLTPQDIIERTLSFTQTENIPLNSVEGFLRQIVGWREFIRGIYQNYSEIQIKSNYFNFSRGLKESWYLGETGIQPLDDAIKHSINFGYTHHINRLMVIANIMTLCEVNPKFIYTWFMEMYIDSSEWVMTPNVFGMGTFADGGIFSTKPYICGSNYLLKMSNYSKGPWCDTMDGLYWRFISKNIEVIRKNARMTFAKNTLKKLDSNRKNYIFECAESFINKNCYSN